MPMTAQEYLSRGSSQGKMTADEYLSGRSRDRLHERADEILPRTGLDIELGVARPVAKWMYEQTEPIMRDIERIPHEAPPRELLDRPLTPPEIAYEKLPWHGKLGSKIGYMGAKLIGGPLGFLTQTPHHILEGAKEKGVPAAVGEEGMGFLRMLANLPAQAHYMATFGALGLPKSSYYREAVKALYESGGAEPAFSVAILGSPVAKAAARRGGIKVKGEGSTLADVKTAEGRAKKIKAVHRIIEQRSRRRAIKSARESAKVFAEREMPAIKSAKETAAVFKKPEAIADQLDIKYDGLQELPKRGADGRIVKDAGGKIIMDHVYTFTDPKTGGTFNPKTLGEVAPELKALRKKFAAAGVALAEKPFVMKPAEAAAAVLEKEIGTREAAQKSLTGKRYLELRKEGISQKAIEKAKWVVLPGAVAATYLASEGKPKERLKQAALFGVVFAGGAKLSRKPKSRTTLIAEVSFLQRNRKWASETYFADDVARRWKKELPKEAAREDIGAAIEGIENLRTGKKPTLDATQNKIKAEAQQSLETMRKEINEYLRGTGKEEYIKCLEHYLPHFYAGKTKAFVNKWTKESPHAKQRIFPTLKEAVDAGLKPLTQDVALLVPKWADINWRVAANQKFLFDMKHLRDGEGNPVLRTGDKPAPDWVRVEHPAISKVYAYKDAKGKMNLWHGGVWAHPEIVRVMRQAFENPLADRSSIGRFYDSVNAIAKTLQLTLSGFHFIALTESGQAVLAKGRNPLRGLILFGEEAKRLTGRPITWTPSAGKAIQRVHPEIVKDYIEAGGQLGRARADVGYSIVQRNIRAWEAQWRNVPGAKWVPRVLRKVHDLNNKVLWEQTHEGYKIFSFYDLVQNTYRRAERQGVELTGVQRKAIKEKMAHFVNDAFGGQEWESKFWLRPKHLQMSRRLLLAPDWTLSNINIAGRLIKDIHDPVLRRATMIYWRNMAMSVFGTIQTLNYASTGHFTWDNEVGHKLDFDITGLMKHLGPVMDKMPGFEYQPKSRYYVRIAKQAREILSYFQDPLKIVGHKLSPVARQVARQMTSADPGSGFEAGWKRENKEFWESVPLRVKSIAEMFTPFSLRGNQFAFSMPMSRGMTNHKAIKAYQRALDAKQWWVFGKRVTKVGAVKAITKAAQGNQLNIDQLFRVSISSVRGKYYKRFYDALESENFEEANKIAEILYDLGATNETIEQSLKRRAER